VAAHAETRAEAALKAESLIGSPYRYGGISPRGFDCSGLVLYSFADAGVQGLPHSAAALESLAQPVPLDALEPGDLLFFSLVKRKTSHVGIYVGQRSFVHAPSGGKRVERVTFDHVYWGPRLGRAGRLEF
jgi:cell wall-associated NlpC family hydrolase